MGEFFAGILLGHYQGYFFLNIWMQMEIEFEIYIIR